MGKQDILKVVEEHKKPLTVREIIDGLDPEIASVVNGNVYVSIRKLIKQKRIKIVSENPLVVSKL